MSNGVEMLNLPERVHPLAGRTWGGLFDMFAARAALFGAILLSINIVYQQSYLSYFGIRAGLWSVASTLPLLSNFTIVLLALVLWSVAVTASDVNFQRFLEFFNVDSWRFLDVMVIRVIAIFATLAAYLVGQTWYWLFYFSERLSQGSFISSLFLVATIVLMGTYYVFVLNVPRERSQSGFRGKNRIILKFVISFLFMLLVIAYAVVVRWLLLQTDPKSIFSLTRLMVPDTKTLGWEGTLCYYGAIIAFCAFSYLKFRTVRKSRLEQLSPRNKGYIKTFVIGVFPLIAMVGSFFSVVIIPNYLGKVFASADVYFMREYQYQQVSSVVLIGTSCLDPWFEEQLKNNSILDFDQGRMESDSVKSMETVHFLGKIQNSLLFVRLSDFNCLETANCVQPCIVSDSVVASIELVNGK